jgi:hypothetical protein
MLTDYVPSAVSKEELGTEGRVRYQILSKLPPEDLHPVLRDRLELVKRYIGPLTSGDIMAAYADYREDSIARWIRDGEDPDRVEWIELQEPETPPPIEPLSEERRQEILDSLFPARRQSLWTRMLNWFS